MHMTIVVPDIPDFPMPPRFGLFFEVTENIIKPLTDSISSSLETLVPIGIGIMATFIGISMIKRVIYTFL